MFWFFIVVFVIVYMFGHQIVWYIKKFFTPFSGRIKNFGDVNGFLANYKIFKFGLYIDSDIGYVSSYIVSVRQIRPIWFPKRIPPYEGFFLKKGAYITCNLQKDKLLRTFVWDHRDEINREFDRNEEYIVSTARNAKIEKENAKAKRDFEKQIKNS